MKRLLLLISAFFIYSNLFSQIPPKPMVYQAIKVNDSDILVDGKIEEEAWDQIEWTNFFQDIQGKAFADPYLITKAKILWSDSMVYIGAYMEEPHIWAKITEDEKVMFYDNDFEVFIDPNGDNHNYFEFEFNALNKKWDLFLQKPYRDTIKPDLAWDCKGLIHETQIYGSINQSNDLDSAWTIEIGIPIHQLTSEIKDGDVWRMDFSRVQWETDILNEEYLKKDLPEHNWVWSPTWKINMHRPEYWGFVQFVDNSLNEIYSISDKNWETRVALMQAYEQRKLHWRKFHNYNSLNTLEQGIVAKENGYRYTLSKSDGKTTWVVNEKGRLWKKQKEKTPKFWIWLGGHGINNLTKWDSIFKDIYSLGIRGVLLNTSPETIRQIIPIANKYDIQIHVWMWAMNRGDAPKEYMSVNDLGKSLAEEKAYVDYYKFMCPALPEVKKFINAKIQELERIDGISGIHLDYIRYVDVFLPKGLLPKYHLVQDDILPEFDYGYHPYMIKKFENTFGFSPKTIPDYPHDSLWQQFRMDQVSNIVNDLAWKFSTKPLKLTAAVFPDPEMSRDMVRQDWGSWNLDYYFPMVYNGFYLEGTDWIEERIRISKKYHPQSAVFCGLFLNDSKTKEDLTEAINAAFNGGASGISFFSYWGMKAYHRDAIRNMSSKSDLYILKK